MRFFNTAGPVKCDEHYCLPPLERLDLEEILLLIGQKQYFALHAPRQTGKTSCMLALMEYINKIGKYKCLYSNVESAQGAREDVKRGIRAILSEIADRAEMYLDDRAPQDIWTDVLARQGEDAALNAVITRWAKKSDRPIVLLIDEIDSLIGDTLISVLRQLRAGYDKRPEMFPQSVILCGVRDIRDYRIHSSKQKEIITGGSAFNVKAASLRLGNFSKYEVKRLYDSHTKETGQAFDNDALELAWKLTQGQPWLTNALGYEVCFKIKENRDRSIPITADMMAVAKENIILRRETHIDQLMDKLQEERVRRVIEPILTGAEKFNHFAEDDLSYVEDLGLIKIKPNVRISNDIYHEVIPRALTYVTQVGISHETHWYVDENGMLDIAKLIAAFQKFFRKHSESWLERFQYREAGSQLLLQAFLQRIVNSGGSVEREYGLGKMRSDLLVIWRHKAGVQNVVIELKIKYGSLERTINKGVGQIVEYMDRCGAQDGHLVIFDRNDNLSWEEKIFQKQKTFQGYTINVWGM